MMTDWKRAAAADVGAALGQAASEMAQAVLMLPLQQEGTDELPARERYFLQSTIWRLRQQLEIALEGSAQDLGNILGSLVNNRVRIERAVIVWVDLVDVLVQDTEVRYGRRPGRGALKASEVKGALTQLLLYGHFELTLTVVPPPLRPMALEILVSWAVDAVVETANQNELWRPAPENPDTPGARLALLRHSIGQLLAALASPVFNLVARVWASVRPHRRLSARAQRAVDAVIAEGFLLPSSDEAQLARALSDAGTWFTSHRRQLLASLRVVSDAVKLAERFDQLSGPDKQAYARDLILSVLEDAGFDLGSGLLRSKVEALINVAIDGTVHLFNKHLGGPPPAVG